MNQGKIYMTDGYYYYIKRDPNESYERFNKRCLFIGKNRPKNKSEYEKLEFYSRIWVNMYYDDMEYGKNISEKIKNYCL